MDNLQFRTAREDDTEALLAIYRPFVTSTAISFEVNVPTLDEFRSRIEKAVAHWGWIVATDGDLPVGYAYGSTHRAREAYAQSVETSAYVAPTHHRTGIARQLYGQLFRALRERGYESAYAGITLPNDASVRFHSALGFESIGTFPRVGYKLGAWHDVAWMYRPIQSD